jgi:hypothetical protein
MRKCVGRDSLNNPQLPEHSVVSHVVMLRDWLDQRIGTVASIANLYTVELGTAVHSGQNFFLSKGKYKYIVQPRPFCVGR